MSDDVTKLKRVDLTSELKAVEEFMRGASVERKIALCTWALDFLSRVAPGTRAAIVEAARQVADQLRGKTVV